MSRARTLASLCDVPDSASPATSVGIGLPPRTDRTVEGVPQLRRATPEIVCDKFLGAGEISDDGICDPGARGPAFVYDQHVVTFGGMGQDGIQGQRVQPSEVQHAALQPAFVLEGSGGPERQPDAVGVADEQ